MFEIQLGPAGAVTMSGRLDATQCEAALKFLDGLAARAEPRVIDLSRLEYIASAGLRVFLLTQKRSKESGAGVRLINFSPHVYDIFASAADQFCDITQAGGWRQASG